MQRNSRKSSIVATACEVQVDTDQVLRKGWGSFSQQNADKLGGKVTALS